MENFPYQADSANEGKVQIGKSKFFSSGHSDLIMDPLEGNKVTVDFETLSIPGAPISISPAKGDNLLENTAKI